MASRHYRPDLTKSKKSYLLGMIIKVTVPSCTLSALLTVLAESLSPNPDYVQGLTIAILVPLLMVPALSYYHANLLYELEVSRKRVRELSQIDELTGLFNRRYFFESAHNALRLAARHGHALSLAIMDFDHFKWVNDTYGHLVGDRVLQKAADLLKGALRRSDVLGRYGGEEFVLLMPHTEIEEADGLLGRLRGSLSSGLAGEDPALPSVTLSAGIACSSKYGCELDALLVKADEALYRAKAEGRDCCRLA